MQFKVPQNVQREDRIVGPLTLKQMIIIAIGGSIAYGLYVSLARYYIWITWLPPVAIVSIVTIAFAFVKPLGLSFTKWVLLWIQFSLLPRDRRWMKGSSEIIVSPGMKQATKKEKGEKAGNEPDTALQKQQKLQKFLEAEKQKNSPS